MANNLDCLLLHPDLRQDKKNPRTRIARPPGSVIIPFFMNISEIQKRLGENIKQIRKSKKLTQFQLAEMANVSEDTIKSLEQGRTWCSDKTLSQITEALEIDVVKLFMPIGESFKKNKENTVKLKSAIAADVRNYVNEVLREFE